MPKVASATRGSLAPRTVQKTSPRNRFIDIDLRLRRMNVTGCWMSILHPSSYAVRVPVLNAKGSAINNLDNLGSKCAPYWVAPIERNHRRSSSTSRIAWDSFCAAIAARFDPRKPLFSRLRSDPRWGAIGHSKVQVISCRSLRGRGCLKSA